jgi:23S rRNA (uracil1939-C5)-methyltransferase
VAGRRFRISPGSFFQAGPAVAEALAGAVSEAVGDALAEGGLLVDAYAWVGLFASVLGAERRARVVAVESDASAVADARVNLADVDATVVASEVGRWRSRPADAVVADPARSGLGRPGVAALAATGAGRLVLVSCDPASLARDTVLLRDAGYMLAAVQLVDAFPHTFHVETVSRFDR